MRTALVLLIGLLAVTSPLLAEDEGEEILGLEEWYWGTDLNITLGQNAYSDSWDGSEAGSLVWAVNSNSIGVRQLSPSMHLRNTLALAFGQTHTQNRESKQWDKPEKSTDLINFESLLRLTYGWFVDPYVAGRVESHFVDESNMNESELFDPTRFAESVGVAKMLIQEEKREWSARLGAALRQSVDRDVLDAGTDESGKLSEQDGGLEFVTEFRSPLAGERINFISRLAAFQALYYSEEDAVADLPTADDWKSPDMDWENTFTANITDFLMVNLYFQFLYDKQIVDEVRMKESLSLGFTFKLL
jgi:hypothetical protein